MSDDVNSPGIKTTELWFTGTTGLVSTILGATAPSETTIVLIISLSITAIAYLTCRTVFKISKLKYRPDSPVSFTAEKDESITP